MTRAGILVLAFALAVPVAAEPGPISLSLGSVRQAAQQAALSYGFNYVANLAAGADTSIKAGRNWFFRWAPEVDIAAASGNAHSRITARASANWCAFGLTDVAGITTPNTAGVLHDVLGSAGFETTDALDAVAGIAEVGYVPWLPKAVRWIGVGVFLQGGYQRHLFEPDTTGGRVAPPEGAVLRARGRLSAEGRFPKSAKRALGLAVRGESWYDFLDHRLHYSAQGIVRFYLDRDLSVDLAYERNSGAPAFEEGNQFGVGLTFRLPQ
jgi:hypothetical protein